MTRFSSSSVLYHNSRGDRERKAQDLGRMDSVMRNVCCAFTSTKSSNKNGFATKTRLTKHRSWASSSVEVFRSTKIAHNIHNITKSNNISNSVLSLRVASSVAAEPSTTSISDSDASTPSPSTSPSPTSVSSSSRPPLTNPTLEEKLAARTEREFATWRRQCSEIRFTNMHEDSLLFSSSSTSSSSACCPYALLGIDRTTTPSPSPELVESQYEMNKQQWKLEMSDEQLERALWERLQNMEQELLLLSNPNYDSSFFFYKKDSDNEEEEKMKQEYALVKRARDLLMDKDR